MISSVSFEVSQVARELLEDSQHTWGYLKRKAREASNLDQAVLYLRAVETQTKNFFSHLEHAFPRLREMEHRLILEKWFNQRTLTCRIIIDRARLREICADPWKLETLRELLLNLEIDWQLEEMCWKRKHELYNFSLEDSPIDFWRVSSMLNDYSSLLSITFKSPQMALRHGFRRETDEFEISVTPCYQKMTERLHQRHTRFILVGEALEMEWALAGMNFTVGLHDRKPEAILASKDCLKRIGNFIAREGKPLTELNELICIESDTPSFSQILHFLLKLEKQQSGLSNANLFRHGKQTYFCSIPSVVTYFCAPAFFEQKYREFAENHWDSISQWLPRDLRGIFKTISDSEEKRVIDKYIVLCDTFYHRTIDYDDLIDSFARHIAYVSGVSYRTISHIVNLVQTELKNEKSIATLLAVSIVLARLYSTGDFDPWGTSLAIGPEILRRILRAFKDKDPNCLTE